MNGKGVFMKIANIYANLIKKGLKDINDIKNEQLKKEVELLLE